MIDFMVTSQCAAGNHMFMILGAQKKIVPYSLIQKKYELYQSGFKTADDFNKTLERIDELFNVIEEYGLSGECKRCQYVHSYKGGCIANKLSSGLKNYWTNHFMQKCVGVDKGKVCFRRLPIWGVIVFAQKAD